MDLAVGSTDGRPHRQVCHAGNHQRPRPCRTAGARSAVAAIRALWRHHDDQHVFRPGRRTGVQGEAKGRRPARRAHPHGHVPLHVGAVQTGLGEQDAGGRPRQGRRDRRQGRRFRQGLDRRPGRPPSQTHPGIHRRGDGPGEEAQQDPDVAHRRACRRAADGRSGRQHPGAQRARSGDPRRFHRHAEGEERLGDLDARARGGAVRLWRRPERPAPHRQSVLPERPDGRTAGAAQVQAPRRRRPTIPTGRAGCACSTPTRRT